jgi:hypothetical protein
VTDDCAKPSAARPSPDMIRSETRD